MTISDLGFSASRNPSSIFILLRHIGQVERPFTAVCADLSKKKNIYSKNLNILKKIKQTILLNIDHTFYVYMVKLNLMVDPYKYSIHLYPMMENFYKIIKKNTKKMKKKCFFLLRTIFLLKKMNNSVVFLNYINDRMDFSLIIITVDLMIHIQIKIDSNLK